jgi:hypothetical protein
VPELPTCGHSTPTSYGELSHRPVRPLHCLQSMAHTDMKAVTHAQVNFPQYHDAVIKYGPEKCIDTLLSAVETIDKLLDLPEPVPSFLKGLFGLEGLSDNADFGDIISSPLGYWQAKNWDPAGMSHRPEDKRRGTELMI